MRRTVALAIVALVVAVAGATAPLASATVRTPTRPNNAFNADGTLTPDATAQLESPNFYAPPPAGVTADEVNAVLNDARMRGSMIPNARAWLNSGGTPQMILLSTAVSLFGHTAVNGYIDAYHALTCWGECTNATNPVGVSGTTYTMTPDRWVYVKAGYDLTQGATTSTGTSANCPGGPSAVNAPGTGGECATADGWYLRGSCHTNTGFGCHLPNTNIYNAYTGNEVVAWATTAAVVAVPGSGPVADNNCGFGFGQTGESCVNAYTWYASDAVFQSSLKVTPATPAQYTASSDKVDFGTYTQHPDPVAAASAFGDPGSQTDAQMGAEDALGGEPSPGPGGATFVPFVIPEPDPSQTYQDYIDALRARGWVGTVTLSTVTTDDSLTGPKGVVSVENTSQGTGPDSIDAWPANALTIRTAADRITIRKNSDGAPAPPAGPTTGLDFTPLTTLDFGCKFPYGMFCYAGDVTAWFDVTPAAPEFNIAIPELSVAGLTLDPGGLDYDVNLDILDSYMALIRGILAVAVVIGGVWVFLSRVLGVQLGDPGAAIDEGLPL